MARSLVRTALAAWHQEELVDDALNVITELVSNAVDHARLPSIRVIVARPADNWVRLGVVDRSRSIPEMRTDSHGDEVDAGASSWATPFRTAGAPTSTAGARRSGQR